MNELDHSSRGNFADTQFYRHHRFASQGVVPQDMALQMFLENKIQMPSLAQRYQPDRSKKQRKQQPIKIDNTPILMLQSPQETMEYLFRQKATAKQNQMYFPGGLTNQARRSKIKQHASTTATTQNNASIDMRTTMAENFTAVNSRAPTPASIQAAESNPLRRSANVQTSFQNMDLQKELSQGKSSVSNVYTNKATASMRPASASVKNSFLRRSIDSRVMKEDAKTASVRNSIDCSSILTKNDSQLKFKTHRYEEAKQRTQALMMKQIGEKTVHTNSNLALKNEESLKRLLQQEENHSRVQTTLQRETNTKNASQLRLHTSYMNRNNSQSSSIVQHESATIIKRPGSSLSPSRNVVVKKKKPISIGQMSRIDRKNLQIKNGELKFKKESHHSQPRASPIRKKPVVAVAETIPVYKRSFVIIDQEKYAYWIEQKKQATMKTQSVEIDGHSPQAKKDENQNDRKLLNEHSLTKMTKKTFQQNNQPINTNNPKRPMTAKAPRMLSHSHIHHQHNEQIHNASLLNQRSSSPLKKQEEAPTHVCSRHVFHHTSKAEILAENKKIIQALQKEIKDIHKAEKDKRDAMTGQLIQADPSKIDEAYRRNVSMREYYRLQALNLNKVFQEAEKEGKVDMVYKIYWNPRKWIKPLDGKEVKDQAL